MMTRQRALWEMYFRDHVAAGHVDGFRRRGVILWGGGRLGLFVLSLMKELAIPMREVWDRDPAASRCAHEGGTSVRTPHPEDVADDTAVILCMGSRDALGVAGQVQGSSLRLLSISELFLALVPEDTSVLEIGVLNNPTFKGGSVRYLDVMDAEGLREKCRGFGVPEDTVPPIIDYVVPDGQLDGIREKFSIIYSSHLIEHMPNLLDHLRQVAAHLEAGGHYLLAIPDKRRFREIIEVSRGLGILPLSLRALKETEKDEFTFYADLVKTGDRGQADEEGTGRRQDEDDFRDYYAVSPVRHKAIVDALMAWKRAGKVVALWGAGNKGTGFLASFDPTGELIDHVFDKDSKKKGRRLATGHTVEAFSGQPVDIMILPDAAFEGQIRHDVADLCGGEPPCRFLCMDDVIFGGFSMEEALARAEQTEEAGCRVAALLILFHPKGDIVSRVRAVLRQVERVYLWDNSPESHAGLFDELPEEQVVYLSDGVNHGVGRPVNEVGDRARADGFDWLLTLDQDSVIPDGMVSAMKKYIGSASFDPRAAILAPFYHEPFSSAAYRFASYAPAVSYLSIMQQSGSLLRLSVLCTLRYDEKFFIDSVDDEFCVRLRLAGYTIIRLNHLMMAHQIDEEAHVMVIGGRRYYQGKYSVLRYYYQYRNQLCCARRYAESAPDFALRSRRGVRSLRERIRQEEDTETLERAFSLAERDQADGVFRRPEDVVSALRRMGDTGSSQTFSYI